MYSLTDLYNQAIQNEPIRITRQYGVSIIDRGFKIQVFPSKTEILNCSKNGDYFQEISQEEYDIFFEHGWVKGCTILNINNNKRKLKLIENMMKREVNSRKNDKFIKNLKSKREFVMNQYSLYTQKLIKYNENGKIKNN